MYKIMYNEIGRCGVAHRLRCYEEYCTCTLASSALLSAVSLARAQLSGKRAQALFAGMATHSVLSLEAPASAAVSLSLMASGHASGWPILRGGAQTLADALARHLEGLGGRIEIDHEVTQLPKSDLILADITPRQLLRIAISTGPLIGKSGKSA